LEGLTQVVFQLSHFVRIHAVGSWLGLEELYPFVDLHQSCVRTGQVRVVIKCLVDVSYAGRHIVHTVHAELEYIVGCDALSGDFEDALG
jgi:hypothetical protein